MRALGRHPGGGGQPDAARAAGDEGGLVLEQSHAKVPFPISASIDAEIEP
ncbi:hypothetical protein [Streptomyces sp. CL7]|nr:hypothetical protein [Streptomyces sp. CL7]WPP34259.1 hypothetical protein SJH97_00550 [Streptomyces sp. CL7]